LAIVTALILLACGGQVAARGEIDQASLIPARAAIHKCADQLQFVELSWSAAKLMRYREWAPHGGSRSLASPDTPVWVVGLEGTWLAAGGKIVTGHGWGVFEAGTGIFLEGRAEEGPGRPPAWDELPDRQMR
jgi:hypothetical protein